MELNEQEAHCVARLLQSALYGKGILDGCLFCKYRCDVNDGRLKMFGAIKDRLTGETGVDLSPITGGDLLGSEFPYFKFLKNANEEVKEYFRNRFKNI